MTRATHIVVGRFAHHGGRLCVARALHPHAPQPWVDLSTGINPHPYPAPRATALARNRLPEPTELSRLEAVAAAAFSVADPSRVVATSGSESALRLMPHVVGWAESSKPNSDARASGVRTEVAIAAPTYGSHADAWRQAGASVHALDSDRLTTFGANGGVAVIVNPNNPDGRIVERSQLQALHDRLAAQGGVLIVDEAFADIDPSISVADLAGSEAAPQLVVLRSFGKFYGLAGVRLGFVIAAPRITNALRRLIGDWPVCADALVAGLAAYADTAWAQRTRERLSHSAQRLDALLTRNGFEIVGGTSLFRLARAADARDRFEHLLRHGVLVRPFDHDAQLLRFGLPGRRNDWQRLTTALQAFQ